MAHAASMKPYWCNISKLKITINEIESHLWLRGVGLYLNYNMLAVHKVNLIQGLKLMTCPEKTDWFSAFLHSCKTKWDSPMSNRIYFARILQSWNLTLPTLQTTAQNVTRMAPKVAQGPTIQRNASQKQYLERPQKSSKRKSRGPKVT